MLPVILNSSNVIAGTNNSQYLYKFPITAQMKDMSVALANIEIFYSWRNITASNNNNTFSYIWYDAGGASTHTVTMPDGFYEISTMNSYLQSVMVANKHYLVDNSGNYVYYLNMGINATYYGVELYSYPIPTSLPAGWTAPGGFTFPAAATTPQFVIQNNNFKTIVGFPAGTYPSVPQNTQYNKLSPNISEVSPIRSVVVLCSLVNNPLSNPNTVIYSFSPADVVYGSTISVKPAEYAWTPIQDGYYSQFTIRFVDQYFNPINILDNELTIQLLFHNITNK